MESPMKPRLPHGFIGAEELGIALILGVQKGHLWSPLWGVYLLISMTHLRRVRGVIHFFVA